MSLTYSYFKRDCTKNVRSDERIKLIWNSSLLVCHFFLLSLIFFRREFSHYQSSLFPFFLIVKQYFEKKNKNSLFLSWVVLKNYASFGAYIVIFTKFGLTLVRRDSMTLDGSNWLNDKIINFLFRNDWRASQAIFVFAYSTHNELLFPASNLTEWFQKRRNLDRKWQHSRLWHDPGDCAQPRSLQPDDDDFKFNIDCPKQGNSNDCGVFTCAFAERFRLRQNLSCTQKDMQHIPK